jgi:hypothetical protein
MPVNTGSTTNAGGASPSHNINTGDATDAGTGGPLMRAALEGPTGEFPTNIFEPVKISEKILCTNNSKNKRTTD